MSLHSIIIYNSDCGKINEYQYDISYCTTKTIQLNLNTNSFGPFNVYLDSTGTFQLVDTTNATQVEKSFGIITSVNEPEDGNMSVKPFGEIKGGLTLTGFSIGDILYYDATASNTSYVTDIKPTTNPLPIYIKISDTTGSLIGGQTSGGSGGSGSA